MLRYQRVERPQGAEENDEPSSRSPRLPPLADTPPESAAPPPGRIEGFFNGDRGRPDSPALAPLLPGNARLHWTTSLPWYMSIPQAKVSVPFSCGGILISTGWFRGSLRVSFKDGNTTSLAHVLSDVRVTTSVIGLPAGIVREPGWKPPPSTVSRKRRSSAERGASRPADIRPSSPERMSRPTASFFCATARHSGCSTMRPM